jgi:hypothetical protein
VGQLSHYIAITVQRLAKINLRLAYRLLNATGKGAQQLQHYDYDFSLFQWTSLLPGSDKSSG